jgi:hypothetical protein
MAEHGISKKDRRLAKLCISRVSLARLVLFPDSEFGRAPRRKIFFWIRVKQGLQAKMCFDVTGKVTEDDCSVSRQRRVSKSVLLSFRLLSMRSRANVQDNWQEP